MLLILYIDQHSTLVGPQMFLLAFPIPGIAIMIFEGIRPCLATLRRVVGEFRVFNLFSRVERREVSLGQGIQRRVF